MSKRPRPGSAASNRFPAAKRGPGAAQKAVMVAKPQKSLRFQVNTVHGPNPEKKEITNAIFTQATPLAASGFTALAAGNVLNAVVQGTTAETRIGRKIRMRSLDVRWFCSIVGAGVASGGEGRVLIVYDKQANAALPAIIAILNTNDFNSPMNLSNSDRFTVLRSFITEPLDLNNNSVISGHEFITMDLETIYNDTNGGTIADIQTGAVYILFGDNGTTTTVAPTFTFISRIRFDDN